MADQEKIMDKIRALLEKTVENGATEQEAIEAAKAAQRLMAKYKISEITAPELEKIDSTEFETRKQWQIELANVLAKNLCCRCIHDTSYARPRIIIMGKKQDREVWEEMFNTFFVLIYKGIKEAKREANEKYGHCREIELAYARGFIRAIHEELGQQCRALALVVPEDVNKATAERYPHLTRERYRAIKGSSATMNARNTGYYDGKAAAGQKRLSA